MGKKKDPKFHRVLFERSEVLTNLITHYIYIASKRSYYHCLLCGQTGPSYNSCKKTKKHCDEHIVKNHSDYLLVTKKLICMI